MMSKWMRLVIKWSIYYMFGGLQSEYSIISMCQVRKILCSYVVHGSWQRVCNVKEIVFHVFGDLGLLIGKQYCVHLFCIAFNAVCSTTQHLCVSWGFILHNKYHTSQNFWYSIVAFGM